MGGWRGILGFDYGVVQGPLGPDISCPELVAAVANAGGIGILRIPDWESPDYLRGLIRKTRSLTDKPFGVGVVLQFPHKENVSAILEEKVALLQVSWGEYPRELVSEAHHAGVKVIHQDFEIGTKVLVWVRLERFPKGAVKKLHARRMGPHKIVQKIGSNAYELDIPRDMGISPMFNVEDLSSYQELEEFPATIPGLYHPHRQEILHQRFRVLQFPLLDDRQIL